MWVVDINPTIMIVVCGRKKKRKKTLGHLILEQGVQWRLQFYCCENVTRTLGAYRPLVLAHVEVLGGPSDPCQVIVIYFKN